MTGQAAVSLFFPAIPACRAKGIGIEIGPESSVVRSEFSSDRAVSVVVPTAALRDGLNALATGQEDTVNISLSPDQITLTGGVAIEPKRTMAMVMQSMNLYDGEGPLIRIFTPTKPTDLVVVSPFVLPTQG